MRTLSSSTTFCRGRELNLLLPTIETALAFAEVGSELRKLGFAVRQNDIWIAAPCKQYFYTLATRDRDFRRVPGLVVANF